MADADLVIHCYGPYGLRQFILKRSSLFDIGHTQNEKRAAARYKPDLMIVDAGLGHGSGVAAVEQILRAGPIAHMFISGDAGRVKTRKPNAVVVRKPFREAELVRAIDSALAAGPRTI
jgi:DNA-binding NarL/FixJ family response regulator